MPSPAFRINGGGVGVKASVAAGGAVTAIINDISGVRSVAWSIVHTDETTSPASYALVQSGAVGQQVDTTALTAGTSATLQAVINGGLDIASDVASDTTRATCKFYVALNGYEVLNAGELEDDNREASATHGAVDPLNKAIRAASATPLKLASVTPAQLTASVNNYAVLTAASIARLSSDNVWNVTGIMAGGAGHYLIIVNVGGNNIVLTHNDAASLEVNRMLLAGAVNQTLTPATAIQLAYDAHSATLRWRQVSAVV